MQTTNVCNKVVIQYQGQRSGMLGESSFNASPLISWHYLYAMFISTVYIVIFITPNRGFENIFDWSLRPSFTCFSIWWLVLSSDSRSAPFVPLYQKKCLFECTSKKNQYKPVFLGSLYLNVFIFFTLICLQDDRNYFSYFPSIMLSDLLKPFIHRLKSITTNL